AARSLCGWSSDVCSSDLLRRRQQEGQRALEHQALHDGLTDLPNRLMFRQQVEAALTERPRLVLLLLDIDNFREINDTFGHKIGDGLLGQIGRRLRHPLEGTASIGIAASPQHGSTAETLIQRADVALYVAKRSGNSAAVYRPEDDPYDPTRVVLQADLRQAIARREIILYYQPQVAIATGAVTGFEALARWRHAQRGWIPPGEFIPVAERIGLIKPLTACLVELAARQLVDWQRSGISIPVAVNVSMRNLLDPRFPATMKDIVAISGVEARSIKLEITESALMTEPGRVVETMSELRALGFGFSIDDFGTGYSSLAYLQRLPVEEIKIDRSFVGELSNNAGSEAIVRATIELAGGLGLGVVAEGVEDEGTWESLRRLGCSTGPGYFLSRPMPATEVEGWLAEWSKRSARTLAALP